MIAKRAMFTEEELAELAEYDRMCELTPLTRKEIADSKERDFWASLEDLDNESAQKRIEDHIRKRKKRTEKRILPGDAKKRAQLATDAWRSRNRERVNELARLQWERKSTKRKEELLYQLSLRAPYDCGAALKLYRKERGMTMLQLGALLGRTDSAISQWERGKAPVPVWVLKQLGIEMRVEEKCMC